MTGAGFQEVKTYISRRQNIVTQFIATRPIIYLCLSATWRQGSSVAKRCWKQDELDLEGMRTADMEAEQTEGGGGGKEGEMETD